jgi:hypothetical protein
MFYSSRSLVRGSQPVGEKGRLNTQLCSHRKRNSICRRRKSSIRSADSSRGTSSSSGITVFDSLRAKLLRRDYSNLGSRAKTRLPGSGVASDMPTVHDGGPNATIGVSAGACTGGVK